MSVSTEALSDVITFTKYAKYQPELERRETYAEIVNRNRAMHKNKFKNNPEIIKQIDYFYENFVLTKKVLPSMRSMQFAGKPIEVNPARIFNCAFAPADHYKIFSESMFLLLGGTGMGYSVQNHHVEKLPPIVPPTRKRRFLIGDSIEGWADAVKALIEAYMKGKSLPVFDYSDIRQKGELLVTSGGKAPGPQPLKDCLHNLKKILDAKEPGSKLKPIEVHDMICYIADAVLAGGIRRAALICLFSMDDYEMLTAKTGNWWELNPQRGRANNSAVILRHRVKKSDFDKMWEIIKESGAGEPGFYFTNNAEWGANPCKPLRSTILTDEGYITFEEALKKESLKVYTPDGRLVNATKPFRTGENREVFKITLSNGMYLYGTENHLHQTQKGEWKRVDELEIGERLAYRVEQRIPTSIDNVEEYEHGMLMGWLYGDGWNYQRSDRTNSKKAGLCFGSNEMDVVELFEEILNKKHSPHSQKPETCKVIRVDQDDLKGLDKTEDLGWLRTKSPEFKLGFIKAIFTADGSVRKQNNVELYSINREWMETIGLVLQEFGIRSTVTVHNYAKSYTAIDGKERNNQTTFKLNVHSGQFKRIGFLSRAKQELVEKQEDKGLYRRVDYETVVDIELDSVEDVYDITVDDECHAFIDTGVSTHNCVEIGLRPNQFCNLVECNGNDVVDQADANARAEAAAFIATLQASYTDFHYLRDVWKRTTEKDALIGVSWTGIASGALDHVDLKECAQRVLDKNAETAEMIDVNPAARTTCVKPAGTTSLVLGCSSGIHGWHAPYYARRVRLGKNEALYQYLAKELPELVEDEFFNPKEQAVVSFPVKAPEGAKFRTESPLELLERVKRFSSDWVSTGHRGGDNGHNVSATISLKDEEWESVGEWMWENRETYNGLSVLPYDGGSYKQAPFEDISKEEYEEMLTHVHNIDLTKVKEVADNTDLSGEVACAGGACDLNL